MKIQLVNYPALYKVSVKTFKGLSGKFTDVIFFGLIIRIRYNNKTYAYPGTAKDVNRTLVSIFTAIAIAIVLLLSQPVFAAQTPKAKKVTKVFHYTVTYNQKEALTIDSLKKAGFNLVDAVKIDNGIRVTFIKY